MQRDDGALKSIFSYLMHLPVTVLKSLPMLLPVAAVSLLKDVDHWPKDMPVMLSLYCQSVLEKIPISLSHLYEFTRLLKLLIQIVRISWVTRCRKSPWIPGGFSPSTLSIQHEVSASILSHLFLSSWKSFYNWEQWWWSSTYHDGEPDWSVDHPVGYWVVISLPAPEGDIDKHDGAFMAHVG